MKNKEQKHDIPDCRYKEQYGVIVICKDEAHQKRVYDQLRAKHEKVKVAVT